MSESDRKIDIYVIVIIQAMWHPSLAFREFWSSRVKVKKISFLARRFIYSGSIRSGFQADFASLSSK